MLDNAYQNRSRAYERLFSMIDIKKALIISKLAGVVLSFKVFEGIYDAPKGLVPLPSTGETSIGGHCVRVTGYDDNQQTLVFANSWGREWGDNGMGYLPYCYLEKYTLECWAPVSKSYWKEFSQDLGKDSFIDNKANSITAELHKVHSVAYGRPHLWVIDLYDKNRKIIGWSHFRIVDFGNVLEIEDIYIHTQFRRCGLGSKILGMIQNKAAQSLISQIRGWVSIQDLIDERNEIVRNYFVRAGFEIIPDTTRFAGSYWQIRKVINQNYYFNGSDQAAASTKIDDKLNEIIAKCPRRETRNSNGQLGVNDVRKKR
jgi:ribosomal protein S18 acetylase RimI-like enzyme